MKMHSVTFSRRLLQPLLCALMLGASGLCAAAYNIWTSEYTFTRQELQQALNTQFPRTVRYLSMVDVGFSHPQLSFDPDNNRILTTVDAAIGSSLLTGKPVNGKLAMSSALKYDPVTRAVRLDAPSVDRIDIAGMPAQDVARINAIGKAVAGQLLNNTVLYTFRPEQLEMNGQHFEPDTITVLSDGIQVGIKQQ